MLDSFLEDYGFTSRQAKIYLACLQLGNATTSTIARFCRENRLTAYSALKELIKKGFLKESSKNKVSYYTAISPQKILSDQESKYNKLHEKMPELMGLMSTNSNKPKMMFYEGLEEIKDAFMMTLEGGKDTGFLSFLGTYKISKKLEHFLTNDFAEKRKKYNVQTKVIATKDNDSYSEFNKLNHETIIIDSPIFEMENEIVIYGENKVSILIYSEQESSAIIIESKSLHNALKNIFLLIWDYNIKKGIS